jgi:hypothetical protein
MTDAPQLVSIDRPCKLQFTIDSIANTAALPEPFSLFLHTRGACASASFTRPKVKGKVDPKSPAVELFVMICDVWWRPALVRFACAANAAAVFPTGAEVLGQGQWELLDAVECCARSNGPDCDFSIDLTAPNAPGEVVVTVSGKVCAVWDEELCEGAACVGDAVEHMITAALAAHDDKRLNELAADLSATVSVLHCLSTIDLLSTSHELWRALPPPDADFTAPAGDVHMRGVLPVTRRSPVSSFKFNVADVTAAVTKPPSHKPPSAKSTPRVAAVDTDAARPPPPPPSAQPLQPAPQMNHTRPATAHPSRKQLDQQLPELEDGASLHSGRALPCHTPVAARVTPPAADGSDKKNRPKSAPIKKVP